jgi:hypothetical protein
VLQTRVDEPDPRAPKLRDNMTNQEPVLAIAAPVRGEARYLIEWIAYHRALGIRVFLLADNGGPDSTSEMLQALHARGVVFRFDWREQSAFQIRFYRQALEACRMGVDGLFLIDVDEFLRPQTGSSVTEIARGWLANPTIGAVALNWAIFGSSGRTEPGDGLVIERFTRRAPPEHFDHRIAKTFVRVACCDGPAENPHAVVLRSGRYVDSRGDDVVWDTSRGHATGITTRSVWDPLRVDHFAVKSHAEFLAKRARGDVLVPNRTWERYFEGHDRNEVEDPVPGELILRTKLEIERLMRSPIIQPGEPVE